MAPPRLAVPEVVTAAVVLLSCLGFAASLAAATATAAAAVAAAMRGGIVRSSTVAGNPMPWTPMIAAASFVDGRDAEGQNPVSLNLPGEAACAHDIQHIIRSTSTLTKL